MLSLVVAVNSCSFTTRMDIRSGSAVWQNYCCWSSLIPLNYEQPNPTVEYRHHDFNKKFLPRHNRYRAAATSYLVYREKGVRQQCAGDRTGRQHGLPPKGGSRCETRGETARLYDEASPREKSVDNGRAIAIDGYHQH